ncbi:MAG: hypothetical protein JST13_04340, partial [Bacteroidetes bacterium]|nr:hypothetical protein [Bacteroidota bacterium]
ICNLWATLYFYKLLAQAFVQPLMAFAGTLILLINFPYQEFNTFLQTESLFYSFTLIFSCYLLSMQNLKAKNIFIIVIALSLISITRPTGMLFIPPTFIYLFFKFFKKWGTRNKIFVASFTAIAFLYVLDKAIGSGGQFDFMLTFRDERVICGVPTLPGFINIKTTENGNSIYGLLYYITHNFSQFARMAWLRTVAFWGLFRSYFSFWHNAYLVLYFYPLHVCAIPGTKKLLKHNTYPALYFILLILIIWATTMLSCDDWHNRFYLSLSPYIIVLGVYAFNKIPKTANVQP